MKKYKLDIELHISCFLLYVRYKQTKKYLHHWFCAYIQYCTIFENRKNISV